MNKLLVVFLLLIGRSEAANFVGTDKEIVQEAERQFQRSAIFWTDKEKQLDYPCPIQYTETNSDNGGGATSWEFNGSRLRYKISVFGERQYVLKNVVPHEVDHLLRGVYTGRPIDNWIGEGCSQLFETPEWKDGIRRRVQYYVQTPEQRFSCWNNLGTYNYPQNTVIHEFYDTSFSVVEDLLFNKGKESLLAFQVDGSPHSESKWAKHFGESSKETYKRWETKYQGPNTKTVVLVASDPATCSYCRVFESDKASGRLTGIDFKYVKPKDLYVGATKYVDPNGRPLDTEQAYGRIPAFRVSGSDTVQVGYAENKGASGLWSWIKSTVALPSTVLETAEGVVAPKRTPAQPQPQTVKEPQPQPQIKDAPPVPIESTPLPYEKDRISVLESKLDSLSGSLEKLGEAIKNVDKNDPETLAAALKSMIDSTKETVDVVKETKDLKKKQEESPQEGESPWYLILIGACLGIIKRRFGNNGLENKS